MTERHGFNLRGKKVIDFGCGAHRPFSGALLYYFCGAKHILAIDLEPAFDVGSVAAGVLSEIMLVIFETSVFELERAGASHDFVLQRVAQIDISALQRDDLRAGLPQNISWCNCFYDDLPSEEKSFDVLISHTVFEHVVDVGATLRSLRRNISPDGHMFISVDYRDHRAYEGTASSFHQYLIDGGAPVGHINKIRHSDFVKIAAREGFELVESELETVIPTSEERAAFLPQYGHLSELDISTCGARMLFRPK